MSVLDIFFKNDPAYRGKLVHMDMDSFGEIWVIDYPDHRILSFGSIYEQSAYSFDHPYQLFHEYTRIMMLALSYLSPGHVTLIGLGGGSLLRSLHYCLPDARFHVIELRQKVYETAKNYFDIPVDNRVSYSIQNAADKIAKLPNKSTDIIFSDIYDAYGMSSLQVQHTYIHHCSRALSSDGWLVINFHRLPDIESTFFKDMLNYFGTIKICSGRQMNHVVFAGKPLSINRSLVSERIAKLEALIEQPFQSLYSRMNRIGKGE